MRALLPFLLVLNLSGHAFAQTDLDQVELREPRIEVKKRYEVAHLCFQAQTGDLGDSHCNFKVSYQDPERDGVIVLTTHHLCQLVDEKATVASEIWLLSTHKETEQLLFRLDCARQVAQAVHGGPSDSERRKVPSSGSAEAGECPVTEKLEAIDDRLRGLGGPSGLAGVVQGQERLSARIDALERTLDRGAPVEPSSGELRCLRSDGDYGGRREVMIALGDRVLRFLEIRPPDEPVAVGLSPERADEMLREAQQAVRDPIFPRIFLSVPRVQRNVAPFFLQDRLFDQHLYELLTGGGDSRRVSHRDAIRVVARLNEICAGVAKLDLPAEEQFVAAAHALYNPVHHGLKPCAAVAAAGADRGLTQLLGHAWQLTRSPCEPFAQGTTPTCDEGSFIRKGGAESSENPLECIPEYRSAAPEAVSQKETSFRLVLVE